MRKIFSFLKSISVFESTASAVSIIAGLINVFLVGGGGVMSYISAKDAPLLEPLGQAGWIVFAVTISVVIALLLWLIAAANRQNANARYLEMMALRDGQIDPSGKHFNNRTIPVHDLNLPSESLHEDKLFEGCVFGGPGAMVIMGGKARGNSFTEVGTLIALPDGAVISGLPVLKDCTIKDSKFHRVTVLCDKGTAQAFQNNGLPVVGLTNDKP
jgi:hypothetical protein